MIIIAVILVTLGIIVGVLFGLYFVKNQIINKPIKQQHEVRPLTEQEQTFVGVWEADDGSLIAIRARGGYDAKNFALDAIYDDTIGDSDGNRAWCKITRDTDITLEQEGELLVISDKFRCPDMNYPDITKTVETEERLEYDASTDTLTHISRHQEFNQTKVFHRTDLDPTDKSIDWDWYYDIHPNRKP